MKLGIFSGTFDPIHEGHVLFARLAMDQFALDEVVFIPEETPRHKSPKASIADRIEMVRLAIDDDPRMHVFNHQLEPSHTVRGVFSAISADYPDDNYVLLMGSDVFEQVGSWGMNANDDGTIQDVGEYIGIVVGIKSLAGIEELEKLSTDLSLNTQFIEQPLYGLSATRIREQVAQGEQPRGVDDEVAKYIHSHKLYRS